MKRYDVVITGGSIAGSIAASRLAKNGLRTLLVEVAKTPREKPCSAIQFKYFEKLIGKKIPKDKLCSNPLKKLYIEWPNEKNFTISFKMLNFTRDIFDNWLNTIAIDSGAEFRDAVRCKSFIYEKNGYVITLQPKHREQEKVYAKYFIAADGLSSTIRKALRPYDYYSKGEKALGVTLNYYIKSENDGNLDSNTLYQFWNLDFNNMMFAWTYKKNDLWVVGTGHTENIVEHCNLLLNYVKKKFNFEGEIVKREGYASKFRLDMPYHVYLGEKNLLFTGDAAGLVDLYRGLGMDAAALSGQHAANAVIKGEKSTSYAIEYYEKAMRNLVLRINKNITKQLINFTSNEELLQFLRKNFIKTGIMTMLGNIINKILPANKIILLPY